MLEDDNTTTTLELIKRINQKIDSPGKNKEKGMAGAHADTDVQKSTLKQYGDSTKTQKTIQSKIHFSTVTKETTMKSKVQKLQKEISRPKSKRIPQGFSLRKEIPKSRQKPICQGHQQIIEYKDECICISTGKCMNCNKPLINVHCCTKHLGNMTSSHLRSFMEKKWREPFVAKVVTELYKLFKVKH